VSVGRGIGALVVLSAACRAPEVDIGGRVLAERGSTDGLAGASLELRDEYFGSYASATTDPEGWFVVQAPRGRKVHIQISGEGTVPIVFPGTSGQFDFIVPEGQLWAMPEAQAEGWQTDFAGCPAAGEGDGLIVGVIRILNPNADPLSEIDNFIDITGMAFIEDGAGQRTDACYLDDEGLAWSPDATAVGSSGRFAFLGVGQGPFRLVVVHPVGSEASVITEQQVYVPAGGVVAMIPALVTL
jgi:hypothetical protein